MVYVLGIHDGHNATASLLKDGKIVACVSEERFNRTKNYIGWPVKAIEWVLKSENININDVSLVVLGSYIINQPGHQSLGKEGSTSAISFYRRMPFSWKKKIYSMPGVFNFLEKIILPKIFKENSETRKKDLTKLLQIDANKIIIAEHHTCHAYTAYYGSGFNTDTLVFTMDGEGDGIFASVNVFKEGRMERIASSKTRNSLGLLYMEVTKLLGMKPNEHEYKVMGLAPYAPEDGVNKSYEVFKDIITLDENNLTFNSKVYSRMFLPYLQEKLAQHRFDWIAGGVQKLTEDLTTKWISKGVEKTGIKNVALAGGVFMNVKANMKISQMPNIENFFVFPSCGDESIAIGAAYFGYEKLCNDGGSPCQIEKLGPIYFGPQYTNEEIEKVINEKDLRGKYNVTYVGDPEMQIALLLSKGEIVARFDGRSEWGARALGNRSIIASAANFDTIRTINMMIKMRDFWMPFAPSIKDTRVDDYLHNPKNLDAPYMILAFESKGKATEHLQAAMHPYDRTVRPQIVKEEYNPKYYNILKYFEQATGMGGILNTSFNLHGEPMVNSPEDAIHTFENSGLKHLVMGNFLIQKR